jgi:hypothetical protein
LLLPGSDRPDGREVEERHAPVKGVKEHFMRAATRAPAGNGRDGDRHGDPVDQSVLVSQERDKREAICKINNEKLAELCAQKPDRFGAFASLPMQFPDLAAEMLETAIKKQGLKGGRIGGSVLGDDFAHEKYHPVLAEGRGARRRALTSIRSRRRSLRSASRATAGSEHDRQSARHHDRAAEADLRGPLDKFPA